MMLKGKVVPRLLEQMHHDGIDSSLLMVKNGSLLGTCGTFSCNGESTTANVMSAVISNILPGIRKCQSSDLQFVSYDVGSQVTRQVLKANLNRFKVALEPILEGIQIDQLQSP